VESDRGRVDGDGDDDTSGDDGRESGGRRDAGPDAAADAPRPRTRGRWVSLRPVRSVDYELIRAAELSDDLAVRWRHRGATPSPEQFAQRLWAGVLAQYLVVAHHDEHVVGLVTAYDADMTSGTVWVGFVRFDSSGHSPLMVEGIVLLVDHLFEHWPFRKLYGETVDFNLAGLRNPLARLLVQEGRLREHVYAAGRYWDLHHLALYRSTWLEWRPRLLPRPTPEPIGATR
jgi:RimJ/RimL family protein N-acetyltransferase